jgi:hypothetical protein
MSSIEKERRTYRFGPVERRGLVGPLRLGQTLCIGGACFVAVIALRGLPSSQGMLAALVVVAIGAAAAIVPVGGRAPIEWLPVLVGVGVLRLSGDHAFRAGHAAQGFEGSVDGSTTRAPTTMPPPLKGCRLLSATLADGSEVGVWHDPELAAYTAVFALEARAVSLLPASEHERRLERWGELLADSACRSSAIRRLQVIEHTAPAGDDALTTYLEQAGMKSLPEAALSSYEELIESATRVYMEHEVLVAVQIDERRAWGRAARDGRRASGTRDEQAIRVLIEELRALAALLQRLDVKVVGLLGPAHLSRTIRLSYDPFLQSPPDGAIGPEACDVQWSTLHSDSAWHRTYWVSQWPRLPVGPVFLTPLLLGTQTVRTVSVVVQPIAPERSRRSAESAVTSDEADDVRREAKGFRRTAMQRRQREATERREEELADGHEELRYAGYVTVSGRTREELLRSCEEIEQAARQSRLELTPCWGEQDVAFAQSALPIARGLRRARALGGS